MFFVVGTPRRESTRSRLAVDTARRESTRSRHVLRTRAESFTRLRQSKILKIHPLECVIMNETELKTFLNKQDTELKQLLTKNDGRIKDTESKLGEAVARLFSLEQFVSARPPGGSGAGFGSSKSIGETMIESEGFAFLQKGGRDSGKINIESFHKTTIINAPGQNQPLVPDYRMPGIVPPGMPALTVRDALSTFRTSSNLIQYTRESSFTNAAAPQAGEGVAKAESAMGFELKNAAVQTLAHWIPASRQVIDDAVGLQDYINSRLMYGLKLVEEDQLLNGNGSGQNLSGLLMNSTAYSGSSSGTVIDMLGSALAQVEAGGFKPDRIILHPKDAWAMYLIKTTLGEYVYSSPIYATIPQIWSVPIITTVNLTRGNFLVGAFKQAAAIWDRWDATIEISREHQDFFVKNLVAILCEERLALTVFQPSAIVHGTFAPGS
jgi:HK97 family phage major capsid protein